MKEVTSIYITSWHQYNNRSGVGGWYELEGLAAMEDSEVFEMLKKDGIDVYGELVVHDFDDYEEIGLYELFGECNPYEVISFYRKFIELDESEQLAFIGLLKTDGKQTALGALEDESLDNYIVLDEDGFTSECEEFIASYLSSYKALDSIYNYIDWEYVGRELAYDWSEFEYKGEGYFIREY